MAHDEEASNISLRKSQYLKKCSIQPITSAHLAVFYSLNDVVARTFRPTSAARPRDRRIGMRSAFFRKLEPCREVPTAHRNETWFLRMTPRFMPLLVTECVESHACLMLTV